MMLSFMTLLGFFFSTLGGALGGADMRGLRLRARLLRLLDINERFSEERIILEFERTLNLKRTGVIQDR